LGTLYRLYALILRDLSNVHHRKWALCSAGCNVWLLFFSVVWFQLTTTAPAVQSSPKGGLHPCLAVEVTNKSPMSSPFFVQKFDTAAQLAEELRAFNREEGLPIDFIPTANALRGAERHDLLAGIRQLGGALTLAPQIGMKTQRGSGFYSTVSVAKELLKFVKQLHKDSGDTRQSWLMPSVYQLRQAGRHDLAAGVYKFGLGQVAQAAALKYNRTRKPSQCTANQLEKHLCDDIKEQSFSQNHISSNCAPVADQHDIAHEIR